MYTQEHDITLYGSTAPGVPLSWEGCQYGCESCPTHSYCTLLVNELLRKRTVKCKAGKQFCSGVSLAAVDVLKYKGFQLIVSTPSHFDDSLAKACVTLAGSVSSSIYAFDQHPCFGYALSNALLYGVVMRRSHSSCSDASVVSTTACRVHFAYHKRVGNAMLSSAQVTLCSPLALLRTLPTRSLTDDHAHSA
jgi:hypothetical protein